MQNDLLSSYSFSLDFDKSTDTQNNLQLAMFACYVSSGMTVKEESLDMVEFKKTTRGIEIKDALDKVVSLKKLMAHQQWWENVSANCTN